MFASTIVLALCLIVCSARPPTVSVNLQHPIGFPVVRRSGRSSLRWIQPSANVSTYQHAPKVVILRGTREQIGYDYAALLANETSTVYNLYLNKITTNVTKQRQFEQFLDFLWNSFYVHHIPRGFLDEIRGMKRWWDLYGNTTNQTVATYEIHRRIIVMANMPADPLNIVSAIVNEYSKDWPVWLQELVRDVIDEIETHTCDAFGVWGTRTVNGTLYTSRNLDYMADTGANRYKLVIVYDIKEGSRRLQYMTFGFSFGLLSLAGMSAHGISVSEMNLDNAQVTYSGLPFPLRLRLVLENARNLESAMTVWNSTANTNSFNFLIGSAPDGEAYALETIMNFTAVFPADSPIEAAATYDCGEPPNVDPTCAKWSPNQPTGVVQIGFPLKEAVWRTNHGMNPTVMLTQERLFNDTIFRYNMMHDLFVDFQQEGQLIGDREAVEIAATLGIKGANFLICEPGIQGSNILSVVYVTGRREVYVAWEEGYHSTWLAAGCAPYIHLNLNTLLALR